MKDLAERLRTLAEAIKACEWELPITASEDCLAAAKLLDGVDAEIERLREECDKHSVYRRYEDAARAARSGE